MATFRGWQRGVREGVRMRGGAKVVEMCGAGGRFDMGLHIINQLPYLWSRATPLRLPTGPYLVCTHSSFLRPARHTGLLNLETLYSPLHAYTPARDTSMEPGVDAVGSNPLRFISASKLMAEVPSKAHLLFYVCPSTAPGKHRARDLPHTRRALG